MIDRMLMGIIVTFALIAFICVELWIWSSGQSFHDNIGGVAVHSAVTVIVSILIFAMKNS